MPVLAIRLLGPFTVTQDGKPATGFDSDKVRGLLAYLATPARLAQAVIGPAVSQSTLSQIKGADSPAQGLTLMLAAPEFMRR